MAKPGHEFRVVILLTAEEYMAMRFTAEEEGLSQSAFIRNVLKKEIRDRALKSVCAERDESEIAEPAHVFTNRNSAESAGRE